MFYKNTRKPNLGFSFYDIDLLERFTKFFFKSARFISVLMAIICPTLFISSCSPTHSTKFKIVLNVQVGDKIYQSYGVQEFRCRQRSKFWGGMDVGGCDVKGEAIPLKVSEKKYLFLLIGLPQDYINQINTPLTGPQVRSADADSIGWEIDLEKAPMLVTFDNINDPKSVKQVHFTSYQEFDHFEIVDKGNDTAPQQEAIMATKEPNAEELLGPNVSLSSIHVERTNEPITHGRIAEVLPWLKGREGGLTLMGLHSMPKNDIPYILQTYNFISGV